MPEILSDTHPEIEPVQDARFREMSAAEKFALVCSLSQSARWAAKRAIQRANPEMTREDVELYFAESHYGPDMARRMRDWYDRRRQ